VLLAETCAAPVVIDNAVALTDDAAVIATSALLRLCASAVTDAADCSAAAAFRSNAALAETLDAASIAAAAETMTLESALMALDALTFALPATTVTAAELIVEEAAISAWTFSNFWPVAVIVAAEASAAEPNRMRPPPAETLELAATAAAALVNVIASALTELDAAMSAADATTVTDEAENAEAAAIAAWPFLRL